MNIKLTENESGEWSAVIMNNPNAIFDATGKTINEAIGAVLVANREVLGLTIEGILKEGTKFWSTEYGESRRWSYEY